jgi:hypothetical protein
MARAGFVLFPVDPSKRARVKWKAEATSDESKIRRWWRKWPDSGIGFPTGERNGVSILDLDKKEGKDGAAELAKRGVTIARLFRYSTPSGGEHVAFEHPAGLRNSAGTIAPGVDVRGEGGYVVAYDPETLVAGRAIGLPRWPAELAPASREEAPAKPQERTGATLDDARRIMFALPLDWCDDRDGWLKAGFALHHEFRDAGRDLWDDWSAQSGKYDPAEQEFAWRSFSRPYGGPKITLRTLARESGESLREIDERGAFEDLPPEEAPKRRLRLLSPDDCVVARARSYVVKGLLAEHDVACLFGPPGGGKSVLAPHLGYAVAQGRDAFGLRTRPGPVLYVAAEDPHGLTSRVRALRERHGNAPDFRVVEGVGDLYRKPSPDLRELIAIDAELKPSLIIVDTLAAAFPGLEENEAKSMGRVVSAGRELAARGAAVLFVHHGTKAEGTTPRGHSILNGALDVAMMLEPGDVIRGALTKNRNGPCSLDVAFHIDSAELGIDEDGDPITAPIARELDGPPPAKLTLAQRVALDVLADMGGEASLEAWAKRCRETPEISSSDSAEARKKATQRAMRELQDKNVVEKYGSIVRIKKQDYAEDFPDE